LKKGAYVCKYIGELIDDVEGERRLCAQKDPGSYMENITGK